MTPRRHPGDASHALTPRELIRQAAAAFREAGVPDPEFDAAALLSHVTGQPALLLRSDAWSALDHDALAAFEALAARRAAREPLQYILGSQPFLGRAFHVDGRVLIPRPETELLAERAIARLRAFGPGARALDLCCGSGCLAVSLALDAPEAQVHAADLSPDALAVTARNADALGAALTLHQGDLFAPVAGLTFDLIVSNPPYIPTGDCPALQAEVLREPALALDGGADGLDFYRRIAAEAPARLTPRGVLLMEVGDGQAAPVAALLAAAGWRDTRVYPDLQGIERMVESYV